MGRLAGQLGNQGFQRIPGWKPEGKKEIEIRQILSKFLPKLRAHFKGYDRVELKEKGCNSTVRLKFWRDLFAYVQTMSRAEQLQRLKPEYIEGYVPPIKPSVVEQPETEDDYRHTNHDIHVWDYWKAKEDAARLAANPPPPTIPFGVIHAKTKAVFGTVRAPDIYAAQTEATAAFGPDAQAVLQSQLKRSP